MIIECKNKKCKFKGKPEDFIYLSGGLKIKVLRVEKIKRKLFVINTDNDIIGDYEIQCPMCNKKI